MKTANELLSDLLWQNGPQMLNSLKAMNDRQSRMMIGRWLKDNKPEDILRAIDKAVQNGTRDPIPYVTATLQGRATNGNGTQICFGTELREVR